MLTIKTPNCEIKGDLIGFNPGTNNLVVDLKDGITVDIARPQEQLLNTIRQVGLHKLGNATFDLRENVPRISIT